MSRVVVTRADSGHTTINLSELPGREQLPAFPICTIRQAIEAFPIR